MNDATLTQLRTTVERAVRPLRASTRRKNQIREELLAHLIASYDEEFESERFTQTVRDALHLAEVESRRREHGFIGTEHLLLGLATERTGTGAAALEAIGVDPTAVPGQVDQRSHCWKRSSQRGVLPRTPRTRQALAFAMEEAQNAGAARVAVEHVIIGLLREPEGVAGKLLAELGVDIVRARAGLARLKPPTPSTLIDDTAAMQRARERFGDPAALTTQLQASVPWSDTIDRFIEWVWFRPGESALRRGVRHGLLIDAFLLVWLIAIGLTVTLMHEDSIVGRALVRQAMFFLPAYFVLTMCFTLLAEMLRRSLYGRVGRSRTRAVVVAVISLALVPAFASVLGVIRADGTADWIALGVFTLIIGPVGIFTLAAAHARQIQAHEHWTSLSLE